MQRNLEQEDASQRLRADALFNDQQNTEEKNHQVPLMSAIYSGATFVLSWIRMPDENMYTAFDMCETTAKEVSSLLIEKIGILDGWKSCQTKMTVRRRCCSTRGMTLGYLVSLFRRPYWQRVWIFQELVLASAVQLISGGRSLVLFSLLQVE